MNMPSNNTTNTNNISSARHYKQNSYNSSNRIADYNTAIISHTEKILGDFSRAEIPVILFKGIALLLDTYEDLSERTMGDIDFLVRPKQLEQAISILENRGFSFVHGNMANAVVYGTSSPIEMYIDLHRSLVNPASPSQKKAYDPSEEDIWARAVPVKIGSEKAFILHPEDRIIYTCFHMLKERFSREKWYRDISLLIQKKGSQINRKSFIETAQQAGTYKLCAMIFDHLSRKKICCPDILEGSSAENEYRFYRPESSLFSFLSGSGVYPLREILWILSMDSAAKKTAFIKDLFSYLPGKFRK